ncbi:MAG: hypothetical protein ACREOA_05745 [Candidatus Dormibacteria bacterium]
MKANTEVTRFPWYREPLVRQTCEVCGKPSPWCAEIGATVLWLIEHEARCWAARR